MDLDERLLRAITGQTGVESHLEPGDRRGPDSDPDSDEEYGVSDTEQSVQSPTNLDLATSRAMSDAAIRRHLDIGGAKTGPKGVMADYKFHQRQERARREIEQQKALSKFESKALKSGWLARQIASEKHQDEELDADELLEEIENEDDDEYLQEYRIKRLAEMARLANRPKFETVVELDSPDAYLSAIDEEDPGVTVMVHLYQNNIEACRVANTFLTLLAQRHPHVKFCRIQSHLADETFDQVALPAMLAYEGGELKGTVMRVLDEVESWKNSGKCDADDLEHVLVEAGLLDDMTTIGNKFGGMVVGVI